MKTLILTLLLFLPIVLLAQTVWEKYPDNPVMVKGASGSWDDEAVAGGTVLFDEDIYKMWYGGYDGRHYRIGYATSPDGINWTKIDTVLDNGPPGSWDDKHVWFPCVRIDGDIYKMWYQGQDGSNYRIGYATSSDGINWIKYDDPSTSDPPFTESDPVLDRGLSGSWESVHVLGPEVVLINNEFIMFYGGCDTEYKFNVGSAKSTDGITWSKDSHNPVMTTTNDWEGQNILPGSVLIVDNQFMAWYVAGNFGSELRTGYATSSDGINWIKDNNGPVLDVGPPGTWDEKLVIVGSVCYDGNKYHLWYDNHNTTNSGAAIGYATSDVSIASPVPDSAEVQHVAGPFNFLEGPVWHPDGFLLCSEMNEERILKINPQTGSMEVYLELPGAPCGLAFDAQQNLIMCLEDDRQLALLNSDSIITILASHYNNKRLNSPNDLVVISDGTIILTDPHFPNSPDPQELSFDGIFALKSDGELVLLDSTFQGPNGICLSPDEEILYVNNAYTKRIYAFDIDNELHLTNKREIGYVSGADFLDGMKVDENGLIYCSSANKGIWIFSPDGEYVDKIDIDGKVLNINWGDADYQTLYITERDHVYKIRLNTKGFITEFPTEVENIKVPIPVKYELEQNYPNPFNPSTTIKYSIPSVETHGHASVQLKVYDILGREVATLVNQQQKPGYYEVEFDASNLTSGVYLYRIRAGEFLDTKKMILIK